MDPCCASMSYGQYVILTSTERLLFDLIRTLNTPMSFDSFPGLGDLSFLCPSGSYGSTAGFQLMSPTVVEGAEFCKTN